MYDASEIQRVIVVVLDGLRPDAIDRFALTHLAGMMRNGAHTLNATTVRPSITTAAITSLLTGVGPSSHGVTGDLMTLPRAKSEVFPLPVILRQAGYPAAGFMCELPLVLRGISGRVARRLGIDPLRVAGRSACEIVEVAGATLQEQRHGLILMHWPDADRAGHEFGWMSKAYSFAALRLDRALGLLADQLDLANDPTTLLVLLTDHGGGGVNATDHDAEHPLNRTIFLSINGACVVRRPLGLVTLLDVPPTILWSLGLAAPPPYEGRVLHEAFAKHTAAIPA